MEVTRSDIKQIASAATDRAIAQVYKSLSSRGRFDLKTEAILRSALDKLIETYLLQGVGAEGRTSVSSVERYQHTPPPWNIVEGNGEARGQSWISVTTINQDVARRICTIENGEHWSTEYQANVRLIAAAPELLEVLDEVMLKVSDGWIDDYSELYERATDVIEKVIQREDDR